MLIAASPFLAWGQSKKRDLLAGQVQKSLSSCTSALLPLLQLFSLQLSSAAAQPRQQSAPSASSATIGNNRR